MSPSWTTTGAGTSRHCASPRRRAPADAQERYPELAPELKRSEFQQLDEHPTVTELREKLAAAREERDTARREASALRWKAKSAARYLAGMLEDE